MKLTRTCPACRLREEEPENFGEQACPRAAARLKLESSADPPLRGIGRGRRHLLHLWVAQPSAWHWVRSWRAFFRLFRPRSGTVCDPIITPQPASQQSLLPAWSMRDRISTHDLLKLGCRHHFRQHHHGRLDHDCPLGGVHPRGGCLLRGSDGQVRSLWLSATGCVCEPRVHEEESVSGAAQGARQQGCPPPG